MTLVPSFGTARRTHLARRTARTARRRLRLVLRTPVGGSPANRRGEHRRTVARTVRSREPTFHVIAQMRSTPALQRPHGLREGLVERASLVVTQQPRGRAGIDRSEERRVGKEG